MVLVFYIIYEQSTKQNVVRDEEMVTYFRFCFSTLAGPIVIYEQGTKHDVVR